MISQLTGSDTVRVWHDQVQFKPPHVGGPTSWHQDHPYWPVIQPADLVSAWVALEDADVENGCMWMVPGSHLWGPHKGGTIGTNPDDFSPLPDLSLLPADATIEPVPCPVRAGQVMFHHCLTWHGSPPNRSGRGRPAIAVHYMPGHTRYVPHGGHLVERRITVAPGEILTGDYFPTVWDRGPLAPPAHT
jgi:ectoine hydroxylase-related dioxygenase (phytanoyl-CoA dioxygenase family)